MEYVSTGILEEIKNISELKIKPKNDMMYQNIYNCICQNTKNEDILSSVSNPQPNWCLKIDFHNGWLPGKLQVLAWAKDGKVQGHQVSMSLLSELISHNFP